MLILRSVWVRFLFRGLSEAIIGACLTGEHVEDPCLVPASTTPFQSSVGRYVDNCCMGQGSFVMDCGALDDVLGARTGAVRVLVFFKIIHFRISCLLMHQCVCVYVPPVL